MAEEETTGPSLADKMQAAMLIGDEPLRVATIVKLAELADQELHAFRRIVQVNHKMEVAEQAVEILRTPAPEPKPQADDDPYAAFAAQSSSSPSGNFDIAGMRYEADQIVELLDDMDGIGDDWFDYGVPAAFKGGIIQNLATRYYDEAAGNWRWGDNQAKTIWDMAIAKHRRMQKEEAERIEARRKAQIAVDEMARACAERERNNGR